MAILVNTQNSHLFFEESVDYNYFEQGLEIDGSYRSPLGVDEMIRYFNSYPPGAAYTCMRQWIGSALVQIMACRLFGAKPSPEPMLVYCQQDSEFYNCHSGKYIWKFRLQNGDHFIQEEMGWSSIPSTTTDNWYTTNECATQYHSKLTYASPSCAVPWQTNYHGS